jgi:hypothetical protein
MKEQDVARIALEAGFMLSTAYGQEKEKLMPVSDIKTLKRFAELLEKEKPTKE